MDALEFNLERRGDATVVNLAGSAGVLNEDVLRRFVDALIKNPTRRVVLNLAKLTFISSVALGMLVSLQRDVKGQGGQVTIASANQNVQKVITRCKLDTLMPVYSSVDEAVGGKKA